MGTQEPLFHEDFRDSLRHLVKALGGVEAVGVELWPSKTRKAAGNWLSDCLNPERAAKLDLEEIVKLLAMGRERGIHCAMHYLSGEAGYEKPDIAAPKNQYELIVADLQRQLAVIAHKAAELSAMDRERVRAVR